MDQQSDKQIELKPCPFCPISQVELVDWNIDHYPPRKPAWRVMCGACGASSGIHRDKDVVVKHWNNRPRGE